jgi:hypothetical protein
MTPDWVDATTLPLLQDSARLDAWPARRPRWRGAVVTNCSPISFIRAARTVTLS